MLTLSAPTPTLGQSNDLTLGGQQAKTGLSPRGKGMALTAVVCLGSPESGPFPSELVAHPPPVSPAQPAGVGTSPLPPPPPGWAGGSKRKWQGLP